MEWVQAPLESHISPEAEQNGSSSSGTTRLPGVVPWPIRCADQVLVHCELQLAHGDRWRVSTRLLCGGGQLAQLGVGESVVIDPQRCGVIARETLDERL